MRPARGAALENWDEIRTAYHVARLGTVSGAAEVLGVHHATVIRHIDALEKRLGTRLFQRHARGYTPTEAGQDLLQVARATEDQFTQLAGRIRGRGEEVSGELVITALPELSPILTPTLVAFREAHPDVLLRYLGDTRVFRLEYGEAHVAIRAGAAPGEPDNVVQRFITLDYALYAAPSYIERFGLPRSEADLAQHWFVGYDGESTRAPFFVWLREAVPEDRIMYRATESRALADAVLEGAGIGFLPPWRARGVDGLVEVLPPRPEWTSPLWLVTHVDLHRTAKVQSLLAHLKASAKDWPLCARD